MKRRVLTALYIAIGCFVALVLLLFIGAATQIEDWSRDLTTNVAATAEGAVDERLRPIEAALVPAELASRTEDSAASLTNWQLAQRQESAEVIELHFIRTTGLWRFKDDIRVRIEPARSGARLSAESRSRVGKGDLGQNPRNLRELLAGVRQRLK